MQDQAGDRGRQQRNQQEQLPFSGQGQLIGGAAPGRNQDAIAKPRYKLLKKIYYWALYLSKFGHQAQDPVERFQHALERRPLVESDNPSGLLENAGDVGEGGRVGH